MCGIAGYYLNHKISKSNIYDMVRLLKHRGPDNKGFYDHENFTGGMSRLSIMGIDNGLQPLFNEHKNVIVFYNGEIYNYEKIKKFLLKKGHFLSTNSDGEVISHLYEEKGINFLSYIEGMFAISLYDKRKKKLYLCRDPIGEKPLYYSKLSHNQIIYSSELKSLKQFKKNIFEINNQSIWDFPSFNWIPEPNTIFKNVFSLPNSHYLEITNKDIKLTEYKFKETRKKTGNINQVIHDHLKESIKSRLMSEVPVGSFLSGGIDSSIVSFYSSKIIKNLKTYTIGFKDKEDLYHKNSDESDNAKWFANRINSEHKTIMISSKDFYNSLDKFCYAGDQPFSVSSGLGILKISEAAKSDGVKVLLSGDCADELFGGYEWYKYLSKILISPKKTLNTNMTFLNVEYSIQDRIKALSNYTPQQIAFSLHYYATEREKNFFYTSNFNEECQSSLRYFYEYNQNNKWTSMDFINHDRLFYLKNEMLCKLDRMTMINSIEGRVPFASPEVVGLAKKLKFNQLINSNKLKYVLKKAFEKDLPKKILNRKKHGFNVPLDYWFRNQWKDLLMHTFSEESKLYKERYISKKSINNFNDFYRKSKKINGQTFFSYVMLNKWLENYKEWK